MKKHINIIIGSVVALFAIVSAVFAESKYSAATTNARVTFGAVSTEGKALTAILAKSDKSTASVSLFAAGGAGKERIRTASTSGAQVVSFDTTGFATNDLVVYQHANGTLLLTHVAGTIGTGSLALVDGLTAAGSTNDLVYEVTQQGALSIGTTALNLSGDVLFTTPPDSPLVVAADGNTSVVVTVTVKP